MEMKSVANDKAGPGVEPARPKVIARKSTSVPRKREPKCEAEEEEDLCSMQIYEIVGKVKDHPNGAAALAQSKDPQKKPGDPNESIVVGDEILLRISDGKESSKRSKEEEMLDLVDTIKTESPTEKNFTHHFPKKRSLKSPAPASTAKKTISSEGSSQSVKSNSSGIAKDKKLDVPGKKDCENTMSRGKEKTVTASSYSSPKKADDDYREIEQVKPVGRVIVAEVPRECAARGKVGVAVEANERGTGTSNGVSVTEEKTGGKGKEDKKNVPDKVPGEVPNGVPNEVLGDVPMEVPGDKIVQDGGIDLVNEVEEVVVSSGSTWDTGDQPRSDVCGTTDNIDKDNEKGDLIGKLKIDGTGAVGFAKKFTGNAAKRKGTIIGYRKGKIVDMTEEEFEMERVRLEREREKKARLQKEELERKMMEREKMKKERERMKKERMKERERMEREKMEKEKMEKDRIEREKKEKKRMERDEMQIEEMGREKMEKDRMEREKMEKDRMEREKMEKDRMEREKMEKGRIEREKMEKDRMEKEKMERERTEREKMERERMEREKMERERMEREKMEREKMEKERMEEDKRAIQDEEIGSVAEEGPIEDGNKRKRIRKSGGSKSLTAKKRKVEKSKDDESEDERDKGKSNADKSTKKDSVKPGSSICDQSTLEETIDRVASGHLSLPFLENLRGEIKSLSRGDLEELIVQKLCEVITERSTVGHLRKRAEALEKNQERWKEKVQSLTKQIREMDMVMKNYLSEVRRHHTEKSFQMVAPLRVTRSVGLQVSFTSTPSKSAKTMPKCCGDTRHGREKGGKHSHRNVQVSETPNQTIPILPSTSSEMPLAIDSKSKFSTKSGLTITLQPASSSTEAQSTSKPVQIQQPKLSILPATDTPNTSLIDLTGDDDRLAEDSAPDTSQQTVTVGPPGQVKVVNHIQPAQPPVGAVTLLISNPTSSPCCSSPSTSGSTSASTSASSSDSQNRQLVMSGSQSQTTQRHILPAIPTLIYKTNALIQPGSQVVTNQALASAAKLSKHPAPLPQPPVNQIHKPNWKLLPPRPALKISKGETGIVLSWNMTLGPEYETIVSYQLFAYQESDAPPSSSMWKRVGDIKALRLPMACTLTQFLTGHRYYFAETFLKFLKEAGGEVCSEQTILSMLA